MKWIVASDIHDRILNVEWMVHYASQICPNAPMLILGDICSVSTAKRIFCHPGPIHVIWGNVDGDREGICRLAYEDFNGRPQLHGQFADIELDGCQVGMIHHNRIAPFLALSQHFDVVLYGHDHKCHVSTVGRTQLVNPGTLGGMGAPATFAVFDPDTLCSTHVEVDGLR